MLRVLILPAMLLLAGCEGSPARVVGDLAGDVATASDTDADAATQEIIANPGAFTAIRLGGPDTVVFAIGPERAIRVEGNDDARARLRLRIEDDTLVIDREKRGVRFGDGSTATVYVTAPALSRAALAGSGDMQIAGVRDAKLALSVSGSGDLDASDLDVRDLSGSLHGSGTMTLAGAADRVSLSVAGSGDVKANGLRADTAEVAVAGSGDVALTADGSVSASVRGSGDIDIAGSASCSRSTSGSGRIRCGG